MPALFTRMSSPPNSRDRSLPFSLRRHIEMDGDRAAAVCVDFSGYLAPGLVLDIGDQDGGTFELGNRLAVAAPAAPGGPPPPGPSGTAWSPASRPAAFQCSPQA